MENVIVNLVLSLPKNIAAEAGYIVSGDRHLLSMGEFLGIRSCTAECFIGTVMPTLPELRSLSCPPNSSCNPCSQLFRRCR